MPVLTFKSARNDGDRLRGPILLPLSIAMIIAAPVGGALSDRFGSRVICGVGMGIMTVAAVDFQHVSGNHAVKPAAESFFAATGIGAGLFNTPNNSAVMGNVPAQNREIASATLGTMKNIGMVLGEAIAAVLSSNITAATATLKAGGMQGIALRQGAFADAMRITCMVTACCAAAALVLSLVKGKAGETAGQKGSSGS